MHPVMQSLQHQPPQQNYTFSRLFHGAPAVDDRLVTSTRPASAVVSHRYDPHGAPAINVAPPQRYAAILIIYLIYTDNYCMILSKNN